jgi:NACHT domain
MKKQTRSAQSWVHAVLPWLIGAGVGPALVALPVNWAANSLAVAAQRWFRRFRHTDDLSRIIKAATGKSVDLNRGEFNAMRRLLEDEHAWKLLGQGPVESLAALIASTLPERDGRTAEDARQASFAIARGLLEFAVADLDPELFQKVLFARLQRMESHQATVLDEVLLGVQADIVAGLKVLEDLDSAHFTSVMDHLKRVLDKLPSGPAGRGEIAIYLRTLVDWLDSDPWPRRFGSNALTPTAIERKLRVTLLPDSRDDLDADDLARTCLRLVILGGPGSGKTWLARRVARVGAEAALEALERGESPDEIELPLYTTCSRLFSAHGDIRQAVVSSALDQLGDLGGARISAALRTFFAERNTSTILIVDSLDEAPGSDERLRQADTLPWRIILTSRPSSWNKQLDMKEDNSAYRIGELRSLRYPADVEAFIRQWFGNRPDWAENLAAKIRERPDLRQSATVPLILAFYCIIGGSESLPEFGRDLYAKVIRRMLTGHWRGAGDYRLDAEACLQVLQSWARAGALSDPFSGIGAWKDEISTEHLQMREAEEDALNHIATPIGPPDIDTGMVSRVFIHRSIREHLVAAYLASLPVEEAADALLPHVWYDVDWESVAPTALAMHPEHDQLLRALIHRAAGSAQITADISAIDSGFKFSGFLARVAAESDQATWSPEVATMIGQARVALARLGRTDDLGAAVHWEPFNRLSCAALLTTFETQHPNTNDLKLIDTLIHLYPTEADKRRAREALLAMLVEARGEAALGLASGLILLDPPENDKRQAREMILAMLQPGGVAVLGLVGGLTLLDPPENDKRQAREMILDRLVHLVGGRPSPSLVSALVLLNPTEQDKRLARARLLGMLPRQSGSRATTAVVRGMIQLDPTDEEYQQARDVVLGKLDRGNRMAIGMPLALRLLNPTDEQKRRARNTVLAILSNITGSTEVPRLVRSLVELDPPEEDKRQARSTLLTILPRQVRGTATARILRGLTLLDFTEDDKLQVRTRLLEKTDTKSIVREAELFAQFAFTDHDKRQLRAALLAALPEQISGAAIARVLRGLISLDTTREDKRQVRNVLITMLPNSDDRTAKRLVDGLARLEPTVSDLDNWRTWEVPPTVDLLAAVRRNSGVPAWLATLPLLAGL